MYNLDILQKSLTDDISGVTSDFQDQIFKMILWIVIPLIIIAILALLLYVLRTLRHRKIENAIFDIRDTLHRMEQAQIPSKKEATANVQFQYTPLKTNTTSSDQ